MEQFVKPVKVSSKGQVTLPKKVRDRLRTNHIEIVMDGSGVHIRPVRNLSGSLKSYASEYVPLEEVRETLAARVKSSGYRRP